MQDAIREATVQFILERPENWVLARRIVSAMQYVPEVLSRKILDAVDNKLEARMQDNDAGLANWEICSSYKDHCT